jgi:hypothetical protein
MTQPTSEAQHGAVVSVVVVMTGAAAIQNIGISASVLFAIVYGNIVTRSFSLDERRICALDC